tara:strand:+ start:589 stop:900 length:312 start_codon:yes stop_codon:yes gene_type:complete
MLAHNKMSKRQQKKNEKAQKPVQEIDKKYRKTIKENEFKTQKSDIERQNDFSIKQKNSNKKRVSLYLDLSNYKKILEIQNNHFTQHKKKISKSNSINILLNKI